MSELSESVCQAFANEYREIAVDLHKWAVPTDAQFWRNPFRYGNSVGHLVLHLTGNLSYYIGARIAGPATSATATSNSRKPEHQRKAKSLKKFDETIAMVIATVEKQSAERLDRPLHRRARTLRQKSPHPDPPTAPAHLYHHIGQIIYLSRELVR